jgi:hypothetical protein
MALLTLGTPAATTLTGRQFSIDPNYLAAGDMYAIVQGIWQDGGFGAPPNMQIGLGNRLRSVLQAAFSRNGWLYLPGGRGAIKVFQGDWVATDGAGNVFVISQRACPKTLTASGNGTNGSAILTFATSVLPLGWQVGTQLAGTGVAAGALIQAISKDGRTVTLSANYTGVTGAVALTAGTWTHS